ncbi:MAG: carboxylating nicotinate-nucleotide diphosphorylase [Deltaproteobacteria bacterium]|nr:carboxylating nicotinate-nucleotide diphosphorylase [Deltaproteobacteria bacterium]
MLVMAALAEDIGQGDVTTAAIVTPGDTGEAVIIAKQDLALAGLFIVELVYKRLDRRIKVKPLRGDGETVKKGAALARVSGPLAPILTGERVALNFLQRLSGVATHTAKFVEAIKGSRAAILDTRKTTPCFRLLERYAVKMGGGANHRFGLHDAVLIKDNHIKAAGGVGEAMRRVCSVVHDEGLVEIEASTLKEVAAAVAAGADIILLDNMSPAQIKNALKIINGAAITEVSGGVTLDNVGKFAKTGADFISVGSLTHSAPSVDISMEVRKVCRGKRRG